ncbi:uncharacterized protein LOC130998414 [Salvia miltiorrhiza]|uniref:uncharacterized protein LOC130998414 n=1 Tax=Salvia miltiorrhiza TaxID=226208 RepID=UPI0025AC31E4|nr:uncharacterized protein LOC130998414 [Salvia miltiorrhiza]
MNDAFPMPPPTHKPSYAVVLGPRPVHKQDIPTHKFFALKPKKHDDEASLTILSALYQKQVEEYKFALIGRLLLRKGEKPKPNLELKMELQKLWNIQESWCLIAMGKVWVCIYNLPVECRHLEVIAGIGRHIGLPLKLDNASIQGEFGHFARILIEVDLALELPSSLLINCDEGSFYTEFSYERLPHYCTSLWRAKDNIVNPVAGNAQEKDVLQQTQPTIDVYGPDLLERCLVPVDFRKENDDVVETETQGSEGSDSESEADNIFDERDFKN